jgi:cell division protein FtsL
MRTGQILKISAHSVIIMGIFFAFKFFCLASVEFWAVVLLSFLLWLILRLFAIVGQFIFEIRNDASRVLANIERGLHYSNSLTKEIRDLVEAERIEKKAHEDTSS